jgi:hypothetical protein
MVRVQFIGGVEGEWLGVGVLFNEFPRWTERGWSFPRPERAYCGYTMDKEVGSATNGCIVGILVIDLEEKIVYFCLAAV